MARVSLDLKVLKENTSKIRKMKFRKCLTAWPQFKKISFKDVSLKQLDKCLQQF